MIHSTHSSESRKLNEEERREEFLEFGRQAKALLPLEHQIIQLVKTRIDGLRNPTRSQINEIIAAAYEEITGRGASEDTERVADDVFKRVAPKGLPATIAYIDGIGEVYGAASLNS